MPVRKVIKEIEESRIVAEWRMLSIPSWLEDKDHYYTWAWESLWRRIKRQSGVRYTSMHKGKKLNFLIKCLHSRLPTLTNLNSVHPDLYKDDICKVCKSDVKETQEHLAICEAQETLWQENEKVVVKFIFALLNEDGRKSEVSATQLHNCLFGSR